MPSDNDPAPPTASITRRHGIIWSATPLPPELHRTLAPPAAIATAHPYTEPTSTLVTSSPRGQFVDLRLVLKTPQRNRPEAAAAPAALESGLAFAGLEWAIGGQATYATNADGSKHGRWSHWVSSVAPPSDTDTGTGTATVGAGGTQDAEGTDSRTSFDEGDMLIDTALPQHRIIERGRMPHPATGALEYYVEVWDGVALRMPPAVPGAAVAGEVNRWTVGGQDGRQRVAGLRPGRRTYAVVRCENAAAKLRGLIVWVGQYCQGVLRQGEAVTAERWEYDFVAGEWVRTFRVGDGNLPCGWLVKEPDGIKRGEVLAAPRMLGDAFQWVIIDEDFTEHDS